MKNLIVLAHPNKDSFNAAVANEIAKELQGRGEEVIVRDLYELGFDPVYTLEEMAEQRNGVLRDDVKTEQDLVTNSDRLIFVYPIWWTSMPAILKGYFDRVFSYGFAYAFTQEGEVDGLLKGKTATVINTHGAPKEYYDTIGMSEALRKTSDTGIFEFCGIEPKGHIFLGEIPYIDRLIGEEILKKITSELEREDKLN